MLNFFSCPICEEHSFSQYPVLISVLYLFPGAEERQGKAGKENNLFIFFFRSSNHSAPQYNLVYLFIYLLSKKSHQRIIGPFLLAIQLKEKMLTSCHYLYKAALPEEADALRWTGVSSPQGSKSGAGIVSPAVLPSFCLHCFSVVSPSLKLLKHYKGTPLTTWK